MSRTLIRRTALLATLITPLSIALWKDVQLIAAPDRPSQADIQPEPSPPLLGMAPTGVRDVPPLEAPSESPSTPLPTTQESELPAQIQLDVPFTSQAPHANWDLPYQEACEEASILMVAAFLAGDERQDIPAGEADTEIVSLVEWQRQRELYESITLTQLASVAQEYYGLQADVVEEVSVDTIEAALAEGFPVIIPAAGKMLHNPHFRGGGPWYHMLVVTGYDERDFITNDPGTAHGKQYRYPKHFLINAIHDWNDIPEETHLNPKRMLVLRPA